MTICIAAICQKGSSLIMASDTMITNEGLSIQFEHTTPKMTHLSDKCLALTAGDALAHTELFNMVNGEITRIKAPSIFDIIDTIKGCYQNIRKREICERILNPKGFKDFTDFYKAQNVLVPEIAMSIQHQIDTYEYGLEILIGGVEKNTAHIYRITDPGTSNCFDAIGFHAIGSGLPHALNTLIARGCHIDIELEEGILIVYEAKKLAEKAPGVGRDLTDICILNEEGIREFPRDKIGGLQKIYERWVSKESDWKSQLQELLKNSIGLTK